jgi:hypothetical protein
VRLSLAACWIVAACVPLARADEGMWPFDNVPKDAIRARYGVEVTDAWLRRVQLAAVRFDNGGSGCFVSRDGLVLTNQHVAQETLQKISTKERDAITSGFYARTLEEEVKAPDLELNVLVGTEDVTARVTAAITPGMTSAQAADARRAMLAAIEAESLARTGLRSDVVAFYEGAQYWLHRYRKYTDVRLVFAPEFSVAFGGDRDNFEYPRHDLDVAFVRVYDHSAPLQVENYLPWSPGGAHEGDLVFAAGHPASTARMRTLAHLAFLRDRDYPYRLRLYERQRAALRTYATRGPEEKRQTQDLLYDVENSTKVIAGESRGLQDAALMARKVDQEEKLRRAVAADPKLSRELGDPWAEIEKARASLAEYALEGSLLEGMGGFDSTLLRIGRGLVRLAEEDAKPNGARLREFGEAGRASLELWLYSPAPIYPELERARLSASLAFLRDELGARSPIVQKVLAGASPEERARALVLGTSLADVAARKALTAGGTRAIAESQDPMIALARLVDPGARALRKRREAEVEAVEQAAYARIARARYAVFGPKEYPDATFTLRLSFGVVRGYEEDGRSVRPFTDLAGLFAVAAERPLPERWMAAKRGLALTTPLDFVTTADTVGGSSGSPIIDACGRLVGLNFDRNSHGLVRNFLYDERQARNIAVDLRAVVEALRKVYDARRLVDEIVASSASDCPSPRR